MSTGLAQRLREGTHSLHRQTERAGVMPALLGGTLPAACFHHMQRNLQAIYAALEPALQQWAEHPALAPLRQPALVRAAVLAADLDALHGPDWANALPLLPSARAYAERLQRLAEDAPALLVAHSYVRYLGDLSGGQALGRLVRQAYGLVDGAGSRFFDFGTPEQVRALAAHFRSSLDALPLDAAQQQAQVDEARWAFAQHERLFEELASSLQVDPGAPGNAGGC